MNLIISEQLEEPSSCPYLSEKVRQSRYFYASEVTAIELDKLLSEGWRKFGPLFFQQSCASCLSCTPLRIPVKGFHLSRSQKRVSRKGNSLNVTFGPLDFTPRVFEIYNEHSRTRFSHEDYDLEQFLFAFYTPSCPGLQVSVYLDEKLIGVGWLDQGEKSLSSVYFCFDPMYSDFNLGTFSILAEIDYARQKGFHWYYLGYYVTGNTVTAYKDNFRPREHFDWGTGLWRQQ